MLIPAQDSNDNALVQATSIGNLLRTRRDTELPLSVVHTIVRIDALLRMQCKDPVVRRRLPRMRFLEPWNGLSLVLDLEDRQHLLMSEVTREALRKLAAPRSIQRRLRPCMCEEVDWTLIGWVGTLRAWRFVETPLEWTFGEVLWEAKTNIIFFAQQGTRSRLFKEFRRLVGRPRPSSRSVSPG